MKELKTARLRMRRWRPADREPFAELNADPVVMEHFPAVMDRAASDATADRIEDFMSVHGWGLWALETGGEFIGFTGLSRPSFDAHFTPAVEVGWRLARHAWGNGYATEAAGAALDFAFDHLDLDEVVSFTSVGNTRSRAVMERLTMSHDPADDFDHPNINGNSRLRPHVLYRISPDVWF